MKANELRIGNLLINGDRICVVSAIFKGHFKCETIEQISLDTSIQLNYQPIPLTEQWLLGFGFEHSRVGLFGNAYELNGLSFLYSNFQYQSVQFPRVSIQFVHQLQNLVHAITGQELTINK